MAMAYTPPPLVKGYTPPPIVPGYTPPGGPLGGAAPKAAVVMVVKPAPKSVAKKPVPTPTSAATQAPPQAAAPPRAKQPLLGGTVTAPTLIKVKAHTRARSTASASAADKNAMPATTLPDYSSLLSNSALAAEAAKMVTAAQFPASQALTDESKQSAAAALAQAQTTQGYYKALAGILQQIAPGVQAGYDTAGANDAAFGKGFSDGLAHVQSQLGDEAGNVLAVSGGQGQAGQVTGQIGGTNATDALYNLGGYLPSTSLEAAGAAAGAAAKSLPAAFAGQGAQAIQGIGNQQLVDQKAIAQKINDLKAQVPGLATTYTHQLATEQLAKKGQADTLAARTDTTNLARWTAQQNIKAKQTQLAIEKIVATGTDPATGKLTPAAQAKVAAINQGAERIAQSASRTAAEWTRTNHYLSHEDGTPVVSPDGNFIPQVGYKLDVNGTLVKAPTVRAPAAMSTSSWATQYGKMSTLIDGYYHGVPELTNSSGQVTRPQQDQLTYQDAFSRIKAQWPRVKNAKIYEMLNLYFPPGEGGRPHSQDQILNPSSKASGLLG